MFWYHLISDWQAGQWEGLTATSSRRGIRQMQTLAKDPKARPKIKNIAAIIIRVLFQQ
jgi:hypothetical protein